MSLINDALKRARQAQKRPAISPSGEGTLTAPSPLQPVEDAGRKTPQRLLVVIPVLLLSLGASFWFLFKWKNAEAKATASVARTESTEAQTARPTKTNALALAAATMTKWQERQQSVEMESPDEVKASVQAEAKKTAVRRTEGSVVTESPKAANASLTGPINTGPAPAAGLGLGRLSSSAATAGKAPALPNATTSTNVLSSGVKPSFTPATASESATVANNSSARAAIPVPTTEPMPQPKLQGIFYRLKRPTALIDGRIISLGDEINGYRVIRIERDIVKLTGAGRTNTLTLH